MTPITSIRIHRASTTTRVYDCITLVMGDIHFHADIVSDRQIRLAKKLADSHDASFNVLPELQERVEKALGGKE